MARTRLLHPEFFKHDDLAKLSPLHRLLFQGLWTIADREGRLRDRPARIHVETLPYDECDVDAMLSLLATHGFITRYEVGNEKLITIPSFLSWQKPHKNEQPSELPAPMEVGAKHDQGSAAAQPRIVEVPDNNGSCRAVSVSVSDPVSVQKILSAEPTDSVSSQAPAGAALPEKPAAPVQPLLLVEKTDAERVFEHWRKAWKMNAKTVFDKKRRGAVEDRLAGRYRGQPSRKFTVAELCAAIDGYLLSENHNGAKGTVYGDLELFCRDDGRVEAGLRLSDQSTSAGHPAPSRGNPHGFGYSPPAGIRSAPGIETTERLLEEQRRKREEVQRERQARKAGQT